MKNINVDKESCHVCEHGQMTLQHLTQELHLEGAPVFKVPDIPVYVCSNCGEQMLDIAVSRALDQKFLAVAWEYYADKTNVLPGKVATWMRKVIGLSARELAKRVDIDESTLSQSTAKNSTLDRFVATYLLALIKGKLEGDGSGEEYVNRLVDLRENWPVVDALEVVRFIASQQFTELQQQEQKIRTTQKKAAQKKIQDFSWGFVLKTSQA